MNQNLSFDQVLPALKEGKRVARQFMNVRGIFLFAQVPATINKSIVPNMQSLPQPVKDEFKRRFDDPAQQIDAIYYMNQVAVVYESNVICSYCPSIEDLFSNDWMILE